MNVLYLNPCYNEVCYIGLHCTLLISPSSSGSAVVECLTRDRGAPGFEPH